MVPPENRTCIEINRIKYCKPLMIAEAPPKPAIKGDTRILVTQKGASTKDWHIPKKSGELKSWYSLNSNSGSNNTYTQLPFDVSKIELFIKHNKIDELPVILKVIQDRINLAQEQNKPIVILVGNDHQSEKQYQFITSGEWMGDGQKKLGLLELLNKITHVGYELFKSNPEKRTDISLGLKTKIDILYEKGKKIKDINKQEEFYESEIRSDPELFKAFYGDTQGIIDIFNKEVPSAKQSTAWKFLRIFIQIAFDWNDNIVDEHENSLLIPKQKGYKTVSLGIPMEEEETNPLLMFSPFVDKVTITSLYMAKNINNILDSALPGKPPVIFVSVGSMHIRKDQIPRFIRDGVEVFSICITGGFETKQSVFDQAVKNMGLSNKLFGVKMLNFQAADYLIHLPVT